MDFAFRCGRLLMKSAQSWKSRNGLMLWCLAGLFHKLFYRRHRPVPAFLLFDQPSQANYPPEHDTDGRIDEPPDEDQAAVRRLFTLLRRL